MGYEYDVFISYPHKGHDTAWLEKFFLPDIDRFIEEELGVKAQFFVDRTGIEAGDSWPAAIKRALAISRVLLPIWSVAYFSSKWCMNECSVMRHREKKLELGSVTNVKGIIVPVRLFDGKHYPPFAKDKQWMDATSYNYHTDGFKLAPKYMDFQDETKKFCEGLANCIRNAPEWDENWLKPEWLDDPMDSWESDPQMKKQPEEPSNPTLT